jgi:hypothetical protein
MKYRFAALAASLLLGSVLIPSAALAQNELNHGSSSDIHPDGRGNRSLQTPPRGAGNASGAAAVAGNGISYHGGPVMLGTTHVYYIWYGNWNGNSAPTILQDLATNIAPSPYFNINTTYSDSVPNLVTNKVTFGGSTTDNYSRGTALTDSDIQTIVTNAIEANRLPVDFSGIYFVLTSADVNETTGFCTRYCGWHTYGVIKNTNIKYSFVGNPDRCPSACEAQSTGPNGNAGADGMASVIAHELEESVTDPELNAWYDSSGNENADKCAWTFGSTYGAGNGAQANMHLGNRDFLIQRNWVNASGGYCALSYAVSTTPDFSLSVAPISQSVSSTGGPATYNITVTPSNNFNGAVNFTQTGLNASWVIFSGTILTVTVPAGATAGNYPFTIMGTSDSLVHTTSATLVVTAPPQPTFTISISPSSQSVSRGNQANYTVTITPANGFTGTVALSAGGSKTGLTVSVGSAPPITGAGSVTAPLTATTTSSAKKGNNTLTVTGTYSGAGGPITKSANASLRIN